MDKCEAITGMIDTINERGWCKGVLEDGAGNVCIRGAMNVVFTGRPAGFMDQRTRGEIEAEIEKHIPEAWLIRQRRYHFLGAVVVDFNNDEETTKEDVLDVLQKTKEDVC